MKKIEKKENQLVFSAEMGETIANAIRRYLNQISLLAIDEVEISRNDSPLYDEVIAHRMGLIPLKAGKPGKKLKLSVKKEGTVYSNEIKGEPGIVYKTIPITTLDKGQELEISATLKIGKGSEHSKFSPGLMFYRNLNEVSLDKEFYSEIKKICPNNEIKEKGNKIIILDDRKIEVSDVCEGISNKKGKKAEVTSKDELVITLESFGQLSVEDIFKKSIDALKKDISLVNKKIGKA